jgi:hypothetical protein
MDYRRGISCLFCNSIVFLVVQSGAQARGGLVRAALPYKAVFSSDALSNEIFSFLIWHSLLTGIASSIHDLYLRAIISPDAGMSLLLGVFILTASLLFWHSPGNAHNRVDAK